MGWYDYFHGRTPFEMPELTTLVPAFFILNILKIKHFGPNELSSAWLIWRIRFAKTENMGKNWGEVCDIALGVIRGPTGYPILPSLSLFFLDIYYIVILFMIQKREKR